MIFYKILKASYADIWMMIFGQNLASKDQSRLSEPIKELDILLTQVFVLLTFVMISYLRLASCSSHTVLVAQLFLALFRLLQVCRWISCLDLVTLQIFPYLSRFALYVESMYITAALVLFLICRSFQPAFEQVPFSRVSNLQHFQVLY